MNANLYLTTQNVRTLGRRREINFVKQIKGIFKRFKVKITVLQEIGWKGNVIFISPKYTIFFSEGNRRYNETFCLEGLDKGFGCLRYYLSLRWRKLYEDYVLILASNIYNRLLGLLAYADKIAHSTRYLKGFYSSRHRNTNGIDNKYK